MSKHRPEENWGVFLTRIDDEPAAVTVDLGLRGIAPIVSYPQLFVAELQIQAPRENGFPTAEESNSKLYPIEQAIVGAIQNDQTRAFQVGKIIGGGIVRCFFYGPLQAEHETRDPPSHDGEGKGRSSLGQRLDQAMQAFPDYEYRSFERHEADWATYLQRLYPSPWELQTIMSRRVLDHLKSQGDQSDRLREIEHFIVCPDTAIQTRIAASAAAIGFRCKTYSISQQGSYAVSLHKHGVPDDIDDIMWPLFQLAEQQGAVYDGWDARVVKKIARR